MEKCSFIKCFPGILLIRLFQAADRCRKLFLLALIVVMREIQHIQKFAFSCARNDIVHAAHGVTAVHHDKLIRFSLQNCLDHGFSESAEICMGDLVRHLEVLRHLLQDRACFPEARKQLDRGVFTDIMYHEIFSFL